jgi:DNA-binding NarL/FixJ family response regulator
MERIRVVVADDHVNMTTAIRSVLSGEFDVVAVVGNGSDAIAAVLALDPDVLVTDISMPGLDGLTATRQLKETNVRAKIIMLTMHEDTEFIEAALAAGASGYVTKARLASDLIPAIQEALLGNIYVSRSRKAQQRNLIV